MAAGARAFCLGRSWEVAYRGRERGSSSANSSASPTTRRAHPWGGFSSSGRALPCGHRPLCLNQPHPESPLPPSLCGATPLSGQVMGKSALGPPGNQEWKGQALPHLKSACLAGGHVSLPQLVPRM